MSMHAGPSSSCTTSASSTTRSPAILQQFRLSATPANGSRALRFDPVRVVASPPVAKLWALEMDANRVSPTRASTAETATLLAAQSMDSLRDAHHTSAWYLPAIHADPCKLQQSGLDRRACDPRARERALVEICHVVRHRTAIRHAAREGKLECFSRLD